MLTISVPPGSSLSQLGVQRGRVHGHQHVRRVARRGDVVVGDVDLEGRDAGERAGRGADLGRELGQRGEVVAEQRADADVKRSPVSCMPSPESPAKRMIDPVQLSSVCARSAVSATWTPLSLAGCRWLVRLHGRLRTSAVQSIARARHDTPVWRRPDVA